MTTAATRSEAANEQEDSRPVVHADLSLMANPEGDTRILARARELGRAFNKKQENQRER